MSNKLFSKISYFLIIVLSFTSCRKFLDAKPDKTLQIPSSVSDLQAILDYGALNESNGISFDEASADNYYLPDAVFNGQSTENKNTYLWQNNKYITFPNDWSNIYNIVNIANVVLDNIDKVPVSQQSQSEWANVKGTALFYRAFSFLEGAFIFCKTYVETNSKNDLGLCLKITSDLNAPSVRSNLEDTYDRIIMDLKESISLLPDKPIHVMRPSKESAYALLARAYLSMRVYDSCAKYANLSLMLNSDLMDYNTIDANAEYPFIKFNKEVLFHSITRSGAYYIVSPWFAIVDTSLYNSYDINDLRKATFFASQPPGVRFKGMYENDSRAVFIGLATDEVYLMRAECYARLGNKEAALKDLNDLMITRWKSGLFIPFTAATPQEALSIILTERRKELIFRSLRWMDIKRLNVDGAQISLKRIVNGQTYILPPNDNRFALPLPDDIIRMTGMPQNPL